MLASLAWLSPESKQICAQENNSRAQFHEQLAALDVLPAVGSSWIMRARARGLSEDTTVDGDTADGWDDGDDGFD